MIARGHPEQDHSGPALGEQRRWLPVDGCAPSGKQELVEAQLAGRLHRDGEAVVVRADPLGSLDAAAPEQLGPARRRVARQASHALRQILVAAGSALAGLDQRREVGAAPHVW